jgi:hypothetical protein
MYSSPFLLIILEYTVRIISNIDSVSFIGPSLAANGTALVLPLAARRPMTLDGLERLKKSRTIKPLPIKSQILCYKDIP